MKPLTRSRVMRAFCGDGEKRRGSVTHTLGAWTARGRATVHTDLDVAAPAAPRHLYGAAHPHLDDASRVPLVALLQAIDAR